MLFKIHYLLTISGLTPGVRTKEGANKQVISSQADSLIKISRIWADFFPANTSNQPI
ncbi:ABC transporter [Enterobacter roggenkampii]|nr:ABC transporter [Enterobacter roggenkampii]